MYGKNGAKDARLPGLKEGTMLVRDLDDWFDIYRLGLKNFSVDSIKNDTIVISAYTSDPDRYRAEVTFMEAEYIACPLRFQNFAFDFIPNNTFPRVKIHTKGTLYRFSNLEQPAKLRPQHYYVVAKRIALALYYEENGAEEIERILGKQSIWKYLRKIFSRFLSGKRDVEQKNRSC